MRTSASVPSLKPAGVPEVAVVVPTHERPAMLAALLESLRHQTVSADRYEVIVVDDGSGPATGEVLRREQERGTLTLRSYRQEPAKGPVPARNLGWRAARAPLIAFTDDDGVAAPDWLENGLRYAKAHPGAILQGRIEPVPGQDTGATPWSHVVFSRECGPWYGTGNIFYPRELLEQLEGFDETTFAALGGGDTDLAWRALEAGAQAAFAADAVIFHAVVRLGPVGALRRAARWTQIAALVQRHPGLRRHFVLGVFWTRRHQQFTCAVLALLLPRRLRAVSWLLAAPYVRHLVGRRSGPLLAPYLIARDAVEVFAVVRGALAMRTLVI